MDIIVVLSACILLGFAALGNGKYHCIVNPITVFCGLWGTILLLYSIHAYDIYNASNQSLFLIISGVFMFALGAFAASIFSSKPSQNSSIKPSIETNNSQTINVKLLLVFNVLVFAFLISFGFKVISLLLSGRSISYIHMMYNVIGEEGIMGASSTNKSIVAWFVWPILIASLTTLAVMIQCSTDNSNIFNKFCIVLILVNAGLFTLISGKRSFIVDIIVYSVAVFYMRGKTIKLKGRTKLGIVIIIFAVGWAFNAISVGRGTTSFVQLFYVYLVGCVPHLSIKLQETPVEIVGFTSVYGFFHAPITLINVVLNSSFLTSIRDSMSALVAYTQERVSIGPGMTYNAFLTPFYYFYLDGGWLGNIVLSFIFGVVSTRFYHNFLKKRDFKSVVLYLLIFFSLYMSMVRFQFFQMRYVLSYFYVLVLFKDTTKKVVFKFSK